jgi:hypothetical protein
VFTTTCHWAIPDQTDSHAVITIRFNIIFPSTPASPLHDFRLKCSFRNINCFKTLNEIQMRYWFAALIHYPLLWAYCENWSFSGTHDNKNSKKCMLVGLVTPPQLTLQSQEEMYINQALSLVFTLHSTGFDILFCLILSLVLPDETTRASTSVILTYFSYNHPFPRQLYVTSYASSQACSV